MGEPRLFEGFDVSSENPNDLRAIVPSSLLTKLDALLVQQLRSLEPVGTADGFNFRLFCGPNNYVIEVSRAQGLTLTDAKVIESRYTSSDVIGWPRARADRPEVNARLGENRDKRKGWREGF